ncbi:MAG: succinate dehydrogenase, hydrophobic membrane anchor protein [Hyphomicrobiaceae bacterium]
MSLQTPLNKVRGLGSAKEGANHFWMQRLTAIANIPLVLFLVWTIVTAMGADYVTVRATLSAPFTGLALLLLVLSGTYHMRLGMQVIIEDYIHGEGIKILALLFNTFFAILIAVTCIYAVMKLSLGA